MGTEYINKLTYNYFALTLYIYFNFAVPLNPIRTSITTLESAVAGYNYSITCSVTLVSGLNGNLNITWINSDGQIIYSNGDIILQNQIMVNEVSNLTLYFYPLRTAHNGSYICIAELYSSVLSYPLNSSASYLINVQRRK